MDGFRVPDGKGSGDWGSEGDYLRRDAEELVCGIWIHGLLDQDFWEDAS